MESTRSIRQCLLPLLNDILVKCWREGKVLQYMRDAKITLYKNKDVRSDWNNHREISQIAIAGIAFQCVILPCLQKLTKRVYLEPQCGFRSQCSTTDIIFSCDSCKRNAKNKTCLCISFSLTLLNLSI